MGMKENFLKEVRIGTEIEMMFGKDKEITGTVVSLDLESVRIRRPDGSEANLSLEVIKYYEVVQKPVLKQEIEKQNTPNARLEEKKEETTYNTASHKQLNSQPEHPSNLEKQDSNQNSINDKTSVQEKQILTSSNLITPQNNEISGEVPVFDFHSIESKGLKFEPNYWDKNLKNIKLSSDIKSKCKQNSSKLNQELSALINIINNAAKINELDPKFGRIDQILLRAQALCLEYKSDFLFELLAIVLQTIGQTYNEKFKKTSTNPIINLSDAVIFYKRADYENMTDNSYRYYSTMPITEKNLDNFLFSVPYFIQYAYSDLFQIKQQEINNLPQPIQKKYATIYNHAKSTIQVVNTNIKKQKEINIRKTQLQEFKKLVLDYIKAYDFDRAYKLVDREFKEDPSNKEIADLLQKIGKVRSNAIKFKNLPNDGSYYSKAVRAWHILEDVNEAEENFKKCIDNVEDKSVSALMDYSDMIMHSQGEVKAIKVLKSYWRVPTTTSEQIKYYEKLASLYSKGKDFENLLQSLNSLQDLYSRKLKFYNVPDNKRNSREARSFEYYREKLGNVLFRIATVHSEKGNYALAFQYIDKAIESKFNLSACITLKVSCFIKQNNFSEARELVKKYIEQDYSLIALLEKIDLIEKDTTTQLSIDDPNSQALDDVKVFDNNERSTVLLEEQLQLSLDNEFVIQYESTCSFEGISEERKKRGVYTDEDLKKIEYEIRFSSKSKPKDRADYYLTAACIEKKLNNKSPKYYNFITHSMVFFGHLLLSNKDYDIAKSYYLTSIELSSRASENRIEENAIYGYLNAILKQDDYSVNEGFDFNTVVLLLFTKINGLCSKDEFVIKDVLSLLIASAKIRTLIDENKRNFEQLINIIEMKINLSYSNNEFWLKLTEYVKKIDKRFNVWFTELQLDKYFEKNIENIVGEYKLSVPVTHIDCLYIDEFMSYYKNVKTYQNYSDFDNKIRILSQGKNDLTNFIEKGNEKATLVFKKYLSKIIKISISTIEEIIKQISHNYKPELSIVVPITSFPKNNEKIELSVTISNAENKATARNICLIVKDIKDNTLCEKKISKNLKGGSELPELITIPRAGSEAFTVNIIVRYYDDENKVYDIKKSVSISVETDFEKINNPYITGNPIDKDDMFFGRDFLISSLVQAINDDKKRCIVIYGQKRTGKTSLFRHLQKKLQDKFIILNFSIGADITSERNFYRSVQGEFVSYLEDNDYDDDTLEYFERYTIEDFINFKIFLNKCNKEICAKEKKSILLMIDEFTHIYKYIKSESYGIKDNFMDEWKSLIEGNYFKTIVIGQDNMPEFIKEYSNQFQVTDPILVSYLNIEDAVDLVIEPIRLKNGDSRFLESTGKTIANWFNGQPYYLQCFCYNLVDYINKIQKQNFVTMAVAEKVKDEMLKSKDISFFDNLVNKEDKDGIDLLLKIAKAATDVPGRYILIDNLQLTDFQLAVLEKLAEKGVIDYKKAEKKCRIVIPFFNEWLIKCY